MIPTPGNKKGNLALIKNALNAFVAMDHKALSSDFTFVMHGMEELTPLVQVAQVPAQGRDVVELFGQFGVKFNQQGSWQNAGEMPITFLETVHGALMKRLRESGEKKIYFNCTLTLNCEQLPLGVQPLKFTLYNCWIKLDGTDVSTEDINTPIKPAGTLYYSWVD